MFHSVNKTKVLASNKIIITHHNGMYICTPYCNQNWSIFINIKFAASRVNTYGVSEGIFPSTSFPRLFSTATDTEEKSTEAAKGKTEKREFQAETRMLLDIVARSLYSDKEVS